MIYCDWIDVKDVLVEGWEKKKVQSILMTVVLSVRKDSTVTRKQLQLPLAAKSVSEDGGARPLVQSKSRNVRIAVLAHLVKRRLVQSQKLPSRSATKVDFPKE
jgi:hypothetical protein